MGKGTMGEIPILSHSVVNNLDLTARRYTAIGLAAGVTALPAAGGRAHGILQNAPVVGETAAIMVEGFSFAVYGGAIASDDELTIDANGKVIKLTDAATQKRIGYAQVAGTAGDIQAIKLG
jgi:hypothetical protein